MNTSDTFNSKFTATTEKQNPIFLSLGLMVSDLTKTGFGEAAQKQMKIIRENSGADAAERHTGYFATVEKSANGYKAQFSSDNVSTTAKAGVKINFAGTK